MKQIETTLNIEEKKMDIKNKVAIITGAKRGIGYAIAKSLAKEGVNLAICSLDETNLAKVAKELQTLNNQIKVIFKKVDVRNIEEINDFVDAIIKEWGHIDILINNAGVARAAFLVDADCTDWDLTMDTNVKGPFLLMKQVIPLMKTNGGGHIINICSIAGKRVLPAMSIYCASKFALRGLSLTIKEEVRKDNISVTIIDPGAVDTDIWKDLPGDYDHSKMVQPEDIASGVLFALKNADTCVVDEIQICPKAGKI